MMRQRIFAIADLHMDGGQDKPMDVFGIQWENHFERIAESWCAQVEKDDVVLVPGDISWAMYLEDAAADIQKIGALPGKKVLLKGNHDYWWTGIGKVREALPEGLLALQNDCIVLDECSLAGSRGWVLPTENAPLKAEDERVFRREVLRMELSLQAAREKGGNRPIFVLMHYPPFSETGEESDFTKLFVAYGVQKVVYGHLHGAATKSAFNGVRQGVEYRLVSADALDFKLLRIQ